jgi:hypothetical protein
MSDNNDNKSNILDDYSEIGNGATIIFIIFLVLKLCKVIKWSWLWVFSPIWIIVGIVIIAVIIGMFIKIVKECAK